MTERQKVCAALIASALLHVCGFLFIMLWTWLHPQTSKPLENLKLVEVTVAPTPTPTPANVQFSQLQPEPVATPIPIDTDGSEKTDKAPERALFQSDKNTKAGSELPATGDLPMPSQQGKDRKEISFETKRFALGNADANFVPPPEMEFAPAPPQAEMPRPASTPAPTPMPAPRQEATPKPTPESTPAPTPKAEPTSTPAENAEPLYRPTPIPTASQESTPDELAKPTPVPTAKPAQSVVMLATPPQPRPRPEEISPPQKSGTSVETQQNKIEGGISNRGKTSVEAIGTPVGRYRKKIGDAIGSRWDFYRLQLSPAIGTARVRFFITQKGGIEDLKVLSNDGDQNLVECSVKAIISGKLPEIPSDLAPALDKGRYEVTYTFTIYPN